MDKFPRILFVMLFLAASTLAFAQGKSVTGVVVDGLGEAIIGANVTVNGTTNGTITNVDGQFTLNNVADGATLKVSYIGYVTQTVRLGASNNIRVVLKEDTEMLDEVVVVGYGVQKKSDVTGAMVSVGEKELNAKPVANAFEALQGKVAGVDITSSERPGTVGSIRIRGTRSITAGQGPLYVVDGVPLISGSIESINPRDIESIDILKDASSTAIYGSRGANGVVLVTTKRGKVGALKLNYSGSVTFENLKDKSPAMSASDYITWRRWAKHNVNPTGNPRGDEPDQAKDLDYFGGDDPWATANVMKGWVNGQWDGSKVTDTDWAGIVTQTGITTEHTLSATSGTENAQSFFSLGYLKNEGTQKGQVYERYNAAVSVDIQAKPWFKMGGSVNASWSVQDYGYSRTGQVGTNSGPVDIYSAAKAIPRYGVPYTDEGEIINNPCGSVTNVLTVIDEWKKSTDNRETFRALGSFYAQIDFGKLWEPLQGLTFKSSFGPDFRHTRQGIFLSKESAGRAGGKNYASYNTTRYLSWTLDNLITYNKTIDDHAFTVTLLQSADTHNAENGKMSASQIPNEHFWWYNMGSVDITDAATYGAGMGTGLTEKQMASYMARVNYSYKDRYLLTISGRYDGASQLAKGNKWDFFPSAALGWRIDQEDFLKDVSWISQLKLRLGVGVTGNSNVGAYGTLGNIQAFFVPFGNVLSQAYATNEPYYTKDQVGMSNKKLGWEKTTQFNYGVDFGFLNGRIGGALDIYHSNTNDLLLDMKIPTLTGFSSTVANVGETKNFGIDLSLNLIPVQTRDFEWVSTINASYSKEEIVELSNGKEDDISNAWFIGESIRVHYGIENEGIWQVEDQAEMDKFNANGHKFTAGSVRPKDQNGDYLIDDEDRVILGDKDPKWVLGWTNNFSWKNFELNIELNGRFGYMISTGGEAQYGMYNQRKIDYWTPNNTNADWQKPVYNTAGGDSYSSLLGYKKASFLKIRNISLGYNFDRSLCKKIGIESLKLYAQGKNLGNLYSSVDFMDLDLGTTYYNRGFTFGVQIGF
nr:TonB-dependent receptor [Bacteroides sp. 214]